MTDGIGTYRAASSGSDDGWSTARPVRTGDARDLPAPPPAAGRREAPARAGTQAPTSAARTHAGPRVVVPPPSAPATASPFGPGRPNPWEPAPKHAPAGVLGQVRETAAADGVVERGLPGWGALLVLIAIAGVGGAIDMVTGTHVRGGFNIGIIVASIVAILLVRRSAMFPVVVAPPIVYSVASGVLLYVRSNGLHDRKVLIDTAANWLVYGFPAIAAATAAVLIIAGIRLIVRR
ncbi:DUF6542 domain-containing protein [Jatrophihabitans sp.]|uniref:DUF6542 domain-containing protein n=1 Tax=Jatrophihabitans sp. TaxID=1932789 RepID=UPI0030C6F60B|nr:hypothetical protein [Jatrophihabitans sp.]